MRGHGSSRAQTWIVRAIAGASLVVLLAVPAVSAADHYALSGSIGLSEESRTPTKVTLRLSWELDCEGVAAEDENYSGNAYLINQESGEETYLGGVSGGSGLEFPGLARTDKDYYVTALFRVNCYEDGTLHGSGTKELSSGTALIPAADPTGGGGGGGAGGGGGGGGSPDDPLASGGCAVELLGTPLADNLVGTAAGELIFALGGDDHVAAGDGHDCLIGDTGNDRLLGEEGLDRLTGGSGNDLLVGGPGKNFYDAGSGRDKVKAKNGQKETVRCGPGRDTARVDRSDRVNGCEKISGS